MDFLIFGEKTGIQEDGLDMMFSICIHIMLFWKKLFYY